MSADQLAAQAAEQLRIHEIAGRRLDAAKHQQDAALQEKLALRLKKKEQNAQVLKEDLEKSELLASGKREPPTGVVTFCFMCIKNLADILDQMEEETALKFLEVIHDVIINETKFYNIYVAKEEIGKYLLASEKTEDIINFSLKIHANLNNNKWDPNILKLASCKKLFRPEDNKEDAPPLFCGPRIQIGIHRGEATFKKDGSYSGLAVLKVDSVGNFAQGGQTLLTSVTWEQVDSSKLDQYHKTEPGTFKLDGFSSGCKVVEILPVNLKDRSKFFGSVCAHCNGVIKPNEQFFRALSCVWHMNHFRCFECKIDLGGSFIEIEGSPFCKNCYLLKNAPKCKSCSNPITSGYINALDGYWHPDCFCCKRCMKKPSADVQIYEYNGFPYCAGCYELVVE
ncbi:uncharacterized protein LOC100209364 isoform X2 [Hydra vulgaris]|uniref:Uncharacterized protein LOC100209364 isoform X2 n=1 Tax=Hydra vulgaris TaxID=6087 RepID=A0ABM4BCR9_HYDVU